MIFTVLPPSLAVLQVISILAFFARVYGNLHLLQFLQCVYAKNVQTNCIKFLIFLKTYFSINILISSERNLYLLEDLKDK